MSETFTQIVSRELNVPPDQLADEATCAVPRSWTSLQHLRLIVALQEAFGIRFTPREIRRAVSLGALRELVERRRENP